MSTKPSKEYRLSTSSKNEFSIGWWKQRIKKAKINPCYGYYVFQGTLVKDPKEYPVVQLIASLLKQGKRICDIKNELKNRKIKPRRGKDWDRKTIEKIIMKELEFKTDSRVMHIKEKKD